MTKNDRKQFVTEAYLSARNDVSKVLNAQCPEDYKILIFLDPSISQTIYQIIAASGSPHSILTLEKTQNLKEVREQGYFTDYPCYVYSSLPTIIYLKPPIDDFSDVAKDTLRLQLVYALAKAFFLEKTEANNPRKLSQLYEMDQITKELMLNNIYEQIKESKSPWPWQYFQDLTGVLQMLALYGEADFYQPPDTARGFSVFYNYVIEIVNYVQKRAKLVRQVNLIDLTLDGFAFFVYKKIRQDVFSKDENLDDLPEWLKYLETGPRNIVGSYLLEHLYDQEEENMDAFLAKLFTFRSDSDIVKLWKRQEMKTLVSSLEDKAYEHFHIWHKAKSHYWSSIWPFHARGWDELAKYIRVLQRHKFQNFGQLIDFGKTVDFKGYALVGQRRVSVYEIIDDSIGLEQLLVLHNHAKALREDFLTLLPGFPDVIVFKKMQNMHVGVLLTIDETAEKPKSPYDKKTHTRAVQVTSKKEAYSSDLQDEAIAMEQIDYSNLSKMTQPQMRAMAYLIRQKGGN
ncbi:MAG: hypothetical protein ACTSYA_06120 [Candidatus Kariarchaeaceae archaeon]